MQDQVANKFIPSFLLVLYIDWLKNYFETRNLKNKKLQIIFVNILFTRAKNLILKFKVVKDRFNRIFGKKFEETLVNCLVYDSLVLLIFLFNIKCSCLWSFVLVFCSFFNQNCISTCSSHIDNIFHHHRWFHFPELQTENDSKNEETSETQFQFNSNKFLSIQKIKTSFKNL